MEMGWDDHTQMIAIYTPTIVQGLSRQAFHDDARLPYDYGKAVKKPRLPRLTLPTLGSTMRGKRLRHALAHVIRAKSGR